MQRFLDLFISINCSTCFKRFLRPSSGAQNSTYSVRYCQTNTAASCYRGWDESEFHLSHDSSSIGLTIPDAVCTVLCSWWWAEEPPEICRAIYRNKWIEKTLHLAGCTSEMYLRYTDIWKSKFSQPLFCSLKIFKILREQKSGWENFWPEIPKKRDSYEEVGLYGEIILKLVV